MSGYLSVKVEHVRGAWQACPATEVGARPLSNQEVSHARRMAVIHVPQEWPHGVVCLNCHSLFPCAAVQWAVGVLKSMRWELTDLFDLLEEAEVSR